jgi:hypothetical protein
MSTDLASYACPVSGQLVVLTKGYTHFVLWLPCLGDGLILLCEEMYAETAGYYDCGCGVAGEL